MPPFASPQAERPDAGAKRVAVIVLERASGELFVHQRRADKRAYPGHYGVGAGGSIESTESPEEGAARELLEETGLRCELRPLFEFWFQDGELRHWLFVFLGQPETEPLHDGAEWQWSGWKSRREIAALAEADQLCPDTRLIVDHYFAITSRT